MQAQSLAGLIESAVAKGAFVSPIVVFVHEC
jgi:hypothetical protein